jgi:hypothetical protein
MIYIIIQNKFNNEIGSFHDGERQIVVFYVVISCDPVEWIPRNLLPQRTGSK